MLLVFILAAGLWGVGYFAGTSKKARVVSVSVLLAGVILSHLILPDGHPLREATGGSAALWLASPTAPTIALSPDASTVHPK